MAEYIQHFGAVTYRVNGTGNLKAQFIGFDDVIIKNMAPLVMSPNPGREPRVLANAIGQRMRLKLITTEKDEVMLINRIVVWSKPLFTQYPG